MFARENAHHSQLAYVTNDLDRAVALFESEYGAPGFFVFSNGSTLEPGSNDPHVKIALSRVNGVEIELIEPIGGDAALFTKGLPDGKEELAIQFHHVCIRIDGPIDNWDRHAASIDVERHPIVFSGGLNDDLRFFYTDEHSALGHYVEHVWMSPAMLAQMEAVVPRFPAVA